MHKAATQARPRARVQKIVQIGAALALATGLSGCAMGLTDFNFPSFGLTSKEKPNDAVPPQQGQPSSLAQQQ